LVNKSWNRAGLCRIGSITDLPRIAAPLFSLAICGLALFVLHRLSLDLNYHAVIHALRRMRPKQVWTSIGWTILSYLALIAGDACALTYAGVNVPASVLLLASFCGWALDNTAGFGALTGRAVRGRVYGALGVRPEHIARIMLFIYIAFGMGLAAFAGANALLAGGGRNFFFLPLSLLHITGAILIVIVAASLLTCFRRRSPFVIGRLAFIAPSIKLALVQLLISVIDLLGAAMALWSLLPAGAIDFFTFGAIFSAANALGVLSRIPGGLGIFEAVVLFASQGHLASNHTAAALVAYRGVYFLLPLLFASACLAGFELRRLAGRPASAIGQRMSVAVSLLAPSFLSVITFSIGTMLVVSGATPAVHWRLAVLRGLLPLWAVEISHLLAALAGVFLLFIARGLYHRLDGAWWLALIIASASAALSLGKGLAFDETAAIVFLVLLLAATRQQFTRPAAFLQQPFTPAWFAAIAAVIAGAIGIMFFAFRDVSYRREIWWQFEFDAQASRALRALLGASISALAISLWQLLRTAAGRATAPSAEDLSRAALIIRSQERSAAMLALMSDKSLLFSTSGKSFVMYGKRGRSWIALFDPVGPHEEWAELVWRFVELADAHGGRAAFYQVRPDSLPIYLDAGLRVVKIGEEACIYLQKFSLEGPPRYGLRQALSRAQREGMTFQFLSASEISEQQGVLSSISAAWIASRRGGERRFSVAAFEPRFMSAQSVALCCLRGKPIAFASFMTTDRQTEATVALMRQVPETPPYTMEFVFTHSAMEFKARNFEILSLGMAPLAGLVPTPLSSQWHRAAALLWRHGGLIYNFQGLRSFKNKFRPVWEPRYLAASGVLGPFINLADVAALASGRLKAPSQRKWSAA
jgi:phosphatidylglycerol lysyltransferase